MAPQEKYCSHELSLSRQLCFFWFCNGNNFAFLSYSTHNYSKHHPFFFLFSIIISILLLYYSYLSILNSHFISYQSFFFSLSLFVSRKSGNSSYIFILFFIFLWYLYIQVISLLNFVKFKFLSDHSKNNPLNIDIFKLFN